MIFGIEGLISDVSLDMHNEYVRNLKLKLSVLEKSYPEIISRDFCDITKSRFKYKDEAVFLKSEIKMHELYFSSFGEGYQRSNKIREEFGSEARFLYDLLCGARDEKCDYILISLTRRERVKVDFGSSSILLTADAPMLCIDICEHAYFRDFGFERDAYLKCFLPHLNLSLIDKFCGAKD